MRAERSKEPLGNIMNSFVKKWKPRWLLLKYFGLAKTLTLNPTGNSERKKAEVDRRKRGNTVLKDYFACTTMAAENRTGWKGIVAK